VAIERHHDASFASCDALIDFESLRDLTVVDIYCGVGIDAIAAARQGARAISVATARQHAQLTQRFARQQDIRLDVVVADPDRLPFIDGAFDLVLARGVLMFTPEVERAIEELYRVAKPGGRLAALMLNRWSWYPLLARLSGKQLIQEPEDPPYLRLDSAARARKLFTGLRELQLVIDRFPRRTAERGGISTLLFNLGVVPLFKLLPDWLVRPFGFYLIISGRKP
jgi:SAM-dependent methyltransferase